MWSCEKKEGRLWVWVVEQLLRAHTASLRFSFFHERRRRQLDGSRTQVSSKNQFAGLAIIASVLLLLCRLWLPLGISPFWHSFLTKILTWRQQNEVQMPAASAAADATASAVTAIHRSKVRLPLRKETTDWQLTAEVTMGNVMPCGNGSTNGSEDENPSLDGGNIHWHLSIFKSTLLTFTFLKRLEKQNRQQTEFYFDCQRFPSGKIEQSGRNVQTAKQ